MFLEYLEQDYEALRASCGKCLSTMSRNGKVVSNDPNDADVVELANGENLKELDRQVEVLIIAHSFLHHDRCAYADVFV